ncbi:MAG TPA: phosphoribosyltransferase family protein [Candidatus Paceibacterota bacterium]|nr:phosphoribosyltransferase family protein [Candidatus Paceibacterota bacterium]
MISSLFSHLLRAIIPMRRTEALVDALTTADLERLRASDGLPYRNTSVCALIWELKYNKNPQALALAGEFIAEELLGIAAEEIGTPLLIPVPMHAKRRRERGHNQTESLCKAALAHLGTTYEYAPEALARMRETVRQQGLPRRKRLTNVERSMEVIDAEKVRGRVCIVVDDVSTTGATLAEAARALRKAKARRVYTVALAR